jgi:transcriptional regulator with XRE-family HTH domain
LADRSGVSKGAISQLENDLTQTVNSEIIFPLADCLGVSARWLATGEGDLGVGNDAPSNKSDPLREAVIKKIAGFPVDKINALALILGVAIKEGH